MNCQQVRNHLSDYSEGLLPPQQIEAIREHLTSCERCRSECQTFQTMLSALQTLPSVVPSSHFNVTLRQRLDQIAQRRTVHRPTWQILHTRLILPALVAAVLIMAVGIYLGYQTVQPASSEGRVMAEFASPMASEAEEMQRSAVRPPLQEFVFPQRTQPEDGTSYVLYTVSYDPQGGVIGF